MADLRRALSGLLRRAAASPSVVIFAVALAIRLVYLWEISDSPTFGRPIVDAQTYDQLARAWASGRPLSSELFWQPLFYPSFLALVYRLTGGSMLAVRLIQAGLGALTCVLTFVLGARIFDRRHGWLAGLGLAFCGPALFFDVELLATGWASLWTVVLLLLMLRMREKPSVGRGLALGIVGGAGVLTRPTFLPFLIAGAVWVAVARLRDARRVGVTRRANAVALSRAALAMLVGFSVFTAPAAWLSRELTGSFSILPYSGGLNLYIGNNPHDQQTISTRPGWGWDRLTLLPSLYGVPPGRATSTFFTKQVVGYIREYPLRYAGGIARKGLQLVSSRELPRNVDLYIMREWSSVLSILCWRVWRFGFPFGLLLPLAAVGLVLRRRSMPAPMFLGLGLYGASIVAVFVTSRYRTPLSPLLMVAAAAGWVAAAQTWRADRRRFLRAALPVGLVMLLAGLAGPFPQEATNYRAEMDYCLGMRCVSAGEYEEARDLLVDAIRRRPDYAEAHNGLGVALRALGIESDAIEEYREAIRLQPRNPTPYINLGGLLYEGGDYDGAADCLAIALQYQPYRADTHNRLALALARGGHIEEAVERFYEAVKLSPRNAEMHNNLGSALHEMHNDEEAIKHFEAAILLDPDMIVALDNLASLLIGIDRHAQAAAMYRTAIANAEKRGNARTAAHARIMLKRVLRASPEAR